MFCSGMSARGVRALQPQLAEFAFQGGLELLQIGWGRTVAGLLRNQAKTARLINIPIRPLAIAESHFAANDGAWAGDLVHDERNTCCARRSSDRLRLGSQRRRGGAPCGRPWTG